MILTQKETSLLQDMKSQEKLCVEKYDKYSNDACDQGLKDLFKSISNVEQQHYDSIDKMLNGTVPSMSSGSSSKPQAPQEVSYDLGAENESKKSDEYLCTDCLSTEKHVSSVYNTSVFEFKDTAMRDALNHIQKEEQEHGEQIYKYMEKNGMYQTK